MDTILRPDLMKEHPLRKGEHNDCAVVAHAHITGCSYEEAHRDLLRAGRRPRRGTYGTASRTALAASFHVACVKDVAVRVDYNNAFFSKSYTVAEMLRLLPKEGRYWMAAGHHAFAYINGKVYDNRGKACMRARMKFCFQVELKQFAPAPSLEQTDINAMWERLNKIKL